jgi:hypothetical protein
VYSTIPANTQFGLPENPDKLFQIKKYTVVDSDTTENGQVTNISVSMRRKDRVELLKNGPTPVFPNFTVDITTNEENGAPRTRQFDMFGNHHAFLHERTLQHQNNRHYLQFYMNDKTTSALPFPTATSYKVYTDAKFSNPQLFQLLYKHQQSENSALIDVYSENIDSHNYLKIKEMEILQQSKRWIVRMDNINYFLLIRSGDEFQLINLFCYHLGNSLLFGKLFARNGATEDDKNGTLLECPQCEFKFTDLEQASYNLKIHDGILYAQFDGVKVGRSLMSNQETLQSFIDQHRIKQMI